MNKPDFVAIVKSVRTAMKRHSPEILTGIGIAGMITTTVMAVRATPKALILIDEREKAAEFDGSDEPLPNAERVTAAWRCYIPAAAVGCASVACLIGASSVNIRRNAALATAYTLSESALKEYQEKVVEAIKRSASSATLSPRTVLQISLSKTARSLSLIVEIRFATMYCPEDISKPTLIRSEKQLMN